MESCLSMLGFIAENHNSSGGTCLNLIRPHRWGVGAVHCLASLLRCEGLAVPEVEESGAVYTA